jgi:chromosomal replication initiation ATPase DnaA
MDNCGSGRWRSGAVRPDAGVVTQLTLPLQTQPALGREDFVVAAGNREAVAFIDAWPDWHTSAAVLYGPPSSGKSHLVSIWAQRAGARVVELRDLDDPILRECGAIAVENVDTPAVNEVAEHLLFALIERGGPLLLTGREAPSLWQARMPDLVSRYRSLLAFALWAPDDALLEALTRKLFDDRQLTVPDAVIAHMLRSLERSPAAIRDFVARADQTALAEKRPITVNLIRGLL